MEYTTVDTEVTNLTDGSGVQEAQLITTDEPIEVIVGHFLSGTPVSGEVQYFAAVNFHRELDEDEQARYGEDELDFSTVLVAGEDGTAEEEAVVNVSGGDVVDAQEMFEKVVDNYTVDITESSRRQFYVDENGEVAEQAVAETEDIEEE